MKSTSLPELRTGCRHVGAAGSGLQVVTSPLAASRRCLSPHFASNASSPSATSPLTTSKRPASAGALLRKSPAAKLQETLQISPSPGIAPALGSRDHSLGGAGSPHGCSPPRSPQNLLGLPLHRQFQGRCETILWKNEELEALLRRERIEAAHRVGLVQAECKDQMRLLRATTYAHERTERIARETHTELQDTAEKLRLKEGEHESAACLAHERCMHTEALEGQLQCQKEAHCATAGQLRLRSDELEAVKQVVKQSEAKSEEHLQSLHYMTRQHAVASRQGEDAAERLSLKEGEYKSAASLAHERNVQLEALQAQLRSEEEVHSATAGQLRLRSDELEEQIRLLRAKTDAHERAECFGRKTHTELQDTAERLCLKEGELKTAASLAHERNMQLEALETQLGCHKEAHSATAGQLRLRSDELEEQVRLLRAKTDVHEKAERFGRDTHTELQDTAQRLSLREEDYKSAAILAHERGVQLEVLQAKLQSQQEAHGATTGQLCLMSGELEEHRRLLQSKASDYSVSEQQAAQRQAKLQDTTAELRVLEEQHQTLVGQSKERDTMIQTLTATSRAWQQEHATAKAQADAYSTELQANRMLSQAKTSELQAMERLAKKRETEVQERLVWQAAHLTKVEAKLGETLTQREDRILRAEHEALLYKVESRAYHDELQDASASRNYLEDQLRHVQDVMRTEDPLVGLVGVGRGGFA